MTSTFRYGQVFSSGALGSLAHVWPSLVRLDQFSSGYVSLG